ncbi:hypothetical protein EVAR_2291_1 [Eumeta japonica]|uniref:Reverse transcriptase domain-containing protein n=1 Tax=Eumeta variegata TaxID=151549 RepID=A0A4C1SIP9_EUMVA|nr:hypothetical protein EVAR_2291_1 [Eumeta japonica]
MAANKKADPPHNGLYRILNDGEQLLDFCVKYDLTLVNNFFKKKIEHLITYESGDKQSQIDFILTNRPLLKTFKDCKVIPDEALTTQQKILSLEDNPKTSGTLHYISTDELGRVLTNMKNHKAVRPDNIPAYLWKVRKEDLHLVFIDLEKAFDRIPRKLVWQAMRAQQIPEHYIILMQDIYKVALALN